LLTYININQKEMHMNTLSNSFEKNAFSDEEAIKKANMLSVDDQNYRFSTAARDAQIFAGKRAPRIRLVGGHAVPMADIEEPVLDTPVVAESICVVEVSSIVGESLGAPRVRAGRGLYGLNKKRRENYRSHNG
jgi:hypothetical protein